MFEIELRDKNGDEKERLTADSVVGWEYLRTGGCGQADLSTAFKVGGEFDQKLAPGDEIRIYIANQLRYSGKLLKIERRISGGNEGIDLTFYGFITELGDIIVNETYENMEVSDIVKDILDNSIVGVKKITYDDADIDETDFSVSSIVFNHTVLEAMALLGDLAGDFEWGVDRDKKFYFKRRDTNIRRTYHIGREIYDYREIESHEAVRNVAYVYGHLSSQNQENVLLATLASSGSVNAFGRKEINIYESSVSEQSDANRIGLVNIKKVENRVRQIQVRMKQSDYFVEESHPLGATAIVIEPLPVPQKYGHNFKYGRNKKYGSLKRDQISAIRYTMVGGGLDVALVVSQDVPNTGDQQKQVEFQVKDLQRR